MKLKEPSVHSLDLFVPLAVGAVAVVLSHISSLELLRIVTGFVFVFVASGFPVTRMLPRGSGPIEKLITASVVSLLMTYPAAVLTVLVEGQGASAIFTRHLSTSLTSLFFLSLILAFLVRKRKPRALRIRRLPVLLLLPLIIYASLAFARLNRADVYGDEYDLGYQAYNLVDGIAAGRKALLVSMSQHPPLAITIKHYSMNILEPGGLDALQDWQYRVSEGLTGLLTIVAAFALAKELFSKRAALITATLLSVNNYMVWMGRIFHREMYLTFFMTAAVYFYMIARKKGNSVYVVLAGVAFGSALLVKETAIIIMIIPAYDLLFSKKQRKSILRASLIAMAMFLPVVMYNVAAYLYTGFADVFFSNLFGLPHPLTTPLQGTPLRNLHSMFSYLLDIYSPLVFEVFAVGLALSLVYRRVNRILALWLGASVIFFSVTSVRAYYFLFLSVPLAIILSDLISRLSKVTRTALWLVVIGYSLIYSVNTNLSQSYTVADAKKPDGTVIVTRSPTQNFSLAARSWSEEIGYKNLQSILDNKVDLKDCLLVDESMDQLAARRYLSRMDMIKEHYLGSDYPTRYSRCPADTTSVTGNIFFLNVNPHLDGDLDTVITDHLGNERFYLFRLEKGQNT